MKPNNYIHRGKIKGVVYDLNTKGGIGPILGIKTYKDDDPKFIKLKAYWDHIKEVEIASQYLSKTDYVACKIAEGVATKEDYADIIKKRQEARDIINGKESK